MKATKSAGREHAGGCPTPGFETQTNDQGEEESVAVPSVEFDWPSVYAKDEAADGQRHEIPIETWQADSFPVPIEKAVKKAYAMGLEEGRREAEELVARLLRWADGNGNGTFSGMANRAVVLQWFYNPDYHTCLQTQMLLRYGIQNKQLLNRECIDFRDEFGQLDARFYSEKAREIYRQREASKRSDRDHAAIGAAG